MEVQPGNEQKTVANSTPSGNAGVADRAVKAAPAPGKPVAAAPVIAPPFKIQSSTVSRGAQWLKFLVYAGYGIGKTTLCASAVDVPEMNDVIMISAEKGEMSIFDTDIIKNPEKLDVIPITSFKQCSFIKDFLMAHCVARDANNEEQLKLMQDKLMPNHDGRIRRYKTLIVDSLTEIEAYNMYELLSIDPSSANSLTGDMPVAEFKEYKQNFNKMQLLVRAFRNLPMHVLIICSRTYEQDELKRYHFTLNLTGKLSSAIQGFFDIVGYLIAAEPTEDKAAPRRLWVQPVGGKFDAKTRRASLKKSYFDDPTMITIMREIGLVSK